MAKQEHKEVADYIHPLNINGLKGRMLRMPPPKGKKREILFIYGHHSSLERWWGAVQDLNRYGGVTVPDLPGFGGMDSFYTLGQKPTYDALADYLASFIKLRYKHKKVTIVGLSLGFVIATRMLQRYPDLAKKVDLLISVVGFSHHDDFAFSKRRVWSYRLGAAFFTHRIPAFFFKNLALNPLVLRTGYAKTNNAQAKFKGKSPEELKTAMDFEINLWHSNDVRTHMYTANQFFKLDNCKAQVNLPVWHIGVKKDQYFDQHLVEQHMRIIYSSFNLTISNADSHGPSVIATAEEAAPMLPAKIRRLLAKA